MANLESTMVSNQTGFPRVANEGHLTARMKRVGPASVEVSAAETAGSILRFFRIQSDACISEVLLSCDAIATGAMDVGLYDTDDNGGAVVDADLFASAQAVTAALVASNIAHESGAYTIDNRGKRLWEVLGLSSDPNKAYDVACTVTTGMSAGTIVLEVTYADGGQ